MPKNPSKTVCGTMVTPDKNFNLFRCSYDSPSNTITTNPLLHQAGLAHPLYDRGYTITELKRLVSLPDDFQLTGDYEQQYERCGRMVPPIMMKHIASTIQEEILDRIQ